MGLPLACQFAGRGGSVTVCDVNSGLVQAINRGECPFDEPELDRRLSEAVAAGRLRASVDIGESVSAAEVIVVIVPVLLTEGRDADLGTIERVTRQIAQSMRKGAIVSYETTLPVGTTRGRLLPILERGGLIAGRDFDLVFSPERVKSRLVFQRLTENPKIVGGLTAQGEERAARFYSEYLGAPVQRVGSPEAAEFAKLAGIVYRDVNIALANELARYADEVGVDLWSLIESINSDGEAGLLLPGIGVGGHCTPVYPRFVLADAARRRIAMPITENARHLNDAQPASIVERIETDWGPLSGQRVLILGLGFRPGVKESLYSTAFELAGRLALRKAEVSLHDPLYSDDEIRRHGFRPGKFDDAGILILNTAHPHYQAMDFEGLAKGRLRLVVDGRNLWRPDDVRAAGPAYLGIGRGRPTLAPGTVPLSRLSLVESDCVAVASVIRSGWIMQGPVVESLEREFAAYVGARHACAVSSGTAALQVALLALGIGRDDEVITVSHSFVATANCIRHVGARPVFADIEPDTFNIDPGAVQALITPRTRAILAVHQMGMPCDLERLLAIARAHSLPLVEDAACALGSEIRIDARWERIGRPHGRVACFSFHPRKVISTGDGGMLATDDAELDARFRLLRSHGMAGDAAARSAPDRPGEDACVLAGHNFRMSDLQAALGLQQLRRLDALLAARRSAAGRYREMLGGNPEVVVPADKPWTRSNWQSFCLRLRDKGKQRAVIEGLASRGIACRRGVTCAHREPAYARRDWGCARNGKECGCPPGTCRALANSADAQDSGLILPLFDAIMPQQQEAVVRALAECLGHAA